MSWKQLRLDEMGEVSRGKSKHRPRNDPKLYGGSYPFIQTADVKNADFYITDYRQTYNEVGLAQSKIWPAETLCITIAANIADTAILAFPACFPDSVMGFIPDTNICSSHYIKYCFDIMQAQCKQISQGTAQDNLSWERLSTIKFFCPPLDVQKRVTDILSSYDKLIENSRRQIALLEEAAQRLYKEWFVDLRFPGYETTPIIDGLPEGWRKGKLDEIVEFRRGKTITQNETLDGDVPVVAGGLKPAYYHAHANTTSPVITVSGSGANAGFCRLYTTEIWASDCSFADSSMTDSLYFAYASIKVLSNGFRQCQRGSAQPHVYPKHVNALDVVIPDGVCLSAFNDAAKALCSQIGILNERVSAAREARDRLLPKLMSGEIEVG